MCLYYREVGFCERQVLILTEIKLTFDKKK